MRRYLPVLAAAALLAAVPASVTAAPSGPPEWCDEGQAVWSGGGWLCVGSVDAPTDRIAGTDRYTTAVAVSATFWPDGAQVVYLASGTVPFDALAAGPSLDGPVLLVPTGDNLPAVVEDELARLAPTHVIAIGGPAAVSDAQVDTARVAAGIEP